MTNESLILERLDAMDRRLANMEKRSAAWEELKDDLTPLFNHAFRLLLEELGTVESGFQLEDLFALLKRSMRSVRQLTYTLEQLENVIDLWMTAEPLLKSSVPQLIEYLDRLERRGVFRTYSAVLEARAKVAERYGPEDLAAMGESFALLVGMLKKMSSPAFIDFMNRIMDVPERINLEECRPCGPLGLVAALGSREAREGLGVLLELTRAMGRLKQPADGQDQAGGN